MCWKGGGGGEERKGRYRVDEEVRERDMGRENKKGRDNKSVEKEDER